MLAATRSGRRILGAVLALAATAVAAEAPTSTTEKLVALYLPMQEALAGDSVSAVKDQAGKIATEAAAAITAGGDKATLAAVAAAAKGITATEIQALREQFKPLSVALARMVEKQAVDGHGIVYCPMADAYWIQKRGDVANPYYGKAMLRCGQHVTTVDG